MDEAPNLFIVGAPKCGTTALAHYLRQHPDVFVPAKKELYYFGSDLVIRRRDPFMVHLDESRYRSHFAAGRGRRAICDASVFYLFSETAADEIRAFRPDAKIVIMLRDPVEAIYSLFGENRANGSEDQSDFREALALEPRRRAGEHVPPGSVIVNALFYRAVYSYVPQVKRFLAAFPSKNVHFIIYDEFSADTEREYERTLQFLGVDPTHRPSFERVRAAFAPRYAWIRDGLRRLPLPVIAMAHRVVGRERVLAASRRIVQWNSRPDRRPPMASDLRAALCREYRPQADELEALVHRDLSGWCRASLPAG